MNDEQPVKVADFKTRQDYLIALGIQEHWPEKEIRMYKRERFYEKVKNLVLKIFLELLLPIIVTIITTILMALFLS